MARSAVFAAGLAALSMVLVAFWAVAESPDLLENRAWVERMPKTKKDAVTWLIPMKVRGKRFGVAQRTSHFAFKGERFTYSRQGQRLRMTFQQTDRRVEVKARAYACKGKAPAPFELCLDLTRGGKKVTMYSKKSWTVPRKGESMVPLVDTTPIDGLPCEACNDELPEALGLLFR